MEKNNGVSGDWMNKNTPKLQGLIKNSYKDAQYLDIYGMKFLCRTNHPDEMFIVKRIDEYTPTFAHKICKDKNGYDRYERFFPN